MRTVHSTFILALALMALAWPHADARDVFVNNVVGNDRSTGARASWETGGGPVRTIDRALQIVDRGGRIILANTNEPYREMISLSDVNQRGYSDQPLVIVGGGATLDGTVVAEPGAWHYENDNIFSFRPRRLAYQQLFRNGQLLQHVRLTAYSNAVQLQTHQWSLLSDRIAFRVKEGKLPQHYDLRHAGLQTGITLYNTEFVRIEDLTIQGFQQDGINAHELVRGCELVRVECRANGRSGISVGGVSRVAIFDSNCYDNGRAQIRVEGLARVTTQGCDFDANNADAPWLDLRGGQANIDGQSYQPTGGSP